MVAKYKMGFFHQNHVYSDFAKESIYEKIQIMSAANDTKKTDTNPDSALADRKGKDKN